TVRGLSIADKTGAQQALPLAPGPFNFVRVSPKGGQIAMSIAENAGIDVWVYDLSGTASIRRLTFSGTNAYPLWSLDGQRIVFESGQERNKGLYWQRADGSEPAERLTAAANDADQIPLSWTPDGKTLLFAESGGLWTVSLAGDRKPIRVIEKAGM